MALHRDTIVETVLQAKGLPCFPDVAVQLDQELAKPDYSVSRVQKIIEQDPGLVAKVLQVANSALYPRRGGPTVAIGEALMRLGMRELKRLAIATAVFEEFRDFGRVDEQRFWVHSLSVALTSRAITQFTRAQVSASAQDAAFTAGLLHDLGSLVLHDLFPDACNALTLELEERGGLACDLEREHWGIDHGEAGAILAERWSLPSPIVEVIRYHHRPWQSSATHRELVQLVHMANFICTNQGYGRREGGFPDSFDHSAWDALGLQLEQVPEIISKVGEEGEHSIVFTSALSSKTGGQQRTSSDQKPASRASTSRASARRGRRVD
jgi:HD-like signal output (HDOD) protein